MDARPVQEVWVVRHPLNDWEKRQIMARMQAGQAFERDPERVWSVAVAYRNTALRWEFTRFKPEMLNRMETEETVVLRAAEAQNLSLFDLLALDGVKVLEEEDTCSVTS